MARLFFTDANLIDGTGIVRPGTSIVVEGKRIAAVGVGDAVPAPGADDTVYALNGKTLMPGMVAGHSHLSYPNYDVDDIYSLDMSRPATHIAILAAKNAETTLKAGFTAAAGAGSLHQVDRVLKGLIRDGTIQGPRLLACGRDLLPTGGALDLKPSWWKFGAEGLVYLVDGPMEMRKAVREQIREGNDLIKIFPEGGHGFPIRGMDMQQDEIEAAVQVAHDKGKMVRAHVFSKLGIMSCLKAGVDIIDHGDHLDDEAIEQMVKQGASLLPSLYYVVVVSARKGHEYLERAHGWLERAATMLGRAQTAGVNIVAGDDIGSNVTPHGDNGKELAVYVNQLGLSASDVIGWATRNGARMMRKSEDFGTITPGKLADLIVVDGDPIADITLLGDAANLSVVMQDGRFVTNRLHPARQGQFSQDASAPVAVHG